MPLALDYVDRLGACALLERSELVLGVVGYGGQRPDFLGLACPFVAAPLLPAVSKAAFEIWTASSPTRPCGLGPVIGACSDDAVFGSVTLVESGAVCFETTVERAYSDIFDFLDRTGFGAPLRFWNYLTSIIADDRGLERYQRFNIGRHRAFAAHLGEKLPPAASCVGGDHGASVIYFLAARAPARPIENPRQVSAYAYPPIYGPSSPRFSRASIYTQGGAKALFISGTASIRGHETRHPGDLRNQIAETVENLRALIGVAAHDAVPVAGAWALKIYLRDATDRAGVDAAIDALFGAKGQRLYLRGEICRPGLLVEIEAFHPSI